MYIASIERPRKWRDAFQSLCMQTTATECPGAISSAITTIATQSLHEKRGAQRFAFL